MPQQPEVVPAPPAPPATPAPPAPPAPVAVRVGEQLLPLEGLPRTTEELQGLRERRDILREQLERAVDQREELVRELRPDRREGAEALSPEARAGVQQRLQVVDARIVQLERDQALTERLISNAPPELLAQARAEERQQERESMVGEDDAVAMSTAAFGVGVLLTLFVGRVRAWRRRRRGLGAPAAVAAVEDPRIDRLSHAVEAIAEEVERIGEGQRFVTQLLAQQRDPAAIGGRTDGP